MKSKIILLLLTVLLAGLVGAHALLAQGPKAKIKIEAMSPYRLEEMGLPHHVSSGLSAVGRGTLVYLSGWEATGDTVTAYAWSLTAQPPGSQAILDSTDTQWTTFTPDSSGQYTVELSITTSEGIDDTSVTITAGTWVGVGTIGGATPDVAKGQCGLCHSGNTNAWAQTDHATMLERSLDGLTSAYYRESCIECHSVGYDTTNVVDNGGWDDVATRLGWTFPDTLQVGNWDSLVTNYSDLAALGNIQCENCHGPGSEHKGDKTKIAWSLNSGLCGQCHEEPPYHLKNIQWERSPHAEVPAYPAGRAGCSECHSGAGFIYANDPDFASRFPGVNTGFPSIACQTCHDPHSAGNEHQLRKLADVTLGNGVVIDYGGSGKLCMNCHKSRRNAVVYVQEYHRHYGPHHGPQADMLAGTNAIEYGLTIPSSGHKMAVADACVTCHMADTPAPFGEAGYVGEHTFSMHWDGGTPDDPSDDVENVVTCQGCHGSITSFDDITAKRDFDGDGTVEGVQSEVKGLLHNLGMLLPPIGQPKVVVDTSYTPAQLKAAYNYLFVEEDGSYGVHNANYAIGLLMAAYRSLTVADIGAGTIVSITDVPNDQGKQVRIVWTRFEADGVAANPIVTYAVWRRVDDMGRGALSKQLETGAIKKVDSFGAAVAKPQDVKEGTRFLVKNLGLWDFIKFTQASSKERYSTIAPTLFDSTIVAGMHWSVFYISGHTRQPAVFYESAPDSGYSVDNLAPGAPAGVIAAEIEGGVQLSWEESLDEDFDYFAIYRSDTQGFDPSQTEPIATLTGTEYTDTDVVVGKTYYYRLSAFDFSGNEGQYSDEVSVVVTGVIAENLPNIPKEYALHQNYPNPFNPSTLIKYQLPEAGDVRLAIYTILGQEIKTLVDRHQNAGYYTIYWDGKDSYGNRLSSGVYIYRIQVGDFVATKKMILIK